jgi:tetratricopeptide (TPR) repeat protein
MRRTLPSSRNSFRTLKFAVAVFSILVGASSIALAQTSTDTSSHPSTLKKLQARDELNKGVKAFRKARYDEAIEHLEEAEALDPDLPMVKSYLGVALAQTIVPGLDTKENLDNAQRAIDLFLEILAKDPHDVNSMKQIAGIDYSIKKLDDAKTWQKRVLDENPKDPEAAYTIGVIDWSLAHENLTKALLPTGVAEDGEGDANAPAAAMQPIKAQNGPLVEEALKYLSQAIENRPDYDDAMAYLNLIYRCKADEDWGNEAARKEDIAEADEWRTKAMAARKARAEQNGTAAPSRQ